MSRLIDADRLLKRTKFYDLPNGNRAIDEIDILHAPTVQAIPLDEVKQTREDMCMLSKHGWINLYVALEILDKLLESEKDAVVIKKSLCDSCLVKGCIFQYGIVRNHCDFYKAESERE